MAQAGCEADAGAIAALGQAAEVVGPFWRSDPVLDARIAPLIDAIAAYGPSSGASGSVGAPTSAGSLADLASGWPFCTPQEARDDLALMAAGARKGREALAAEYRRLFVGPLPMPAPPYGSVYTDRDCAVFGESCLALRAWMRAHGIALHEQDAEPEDHIGTMLELLAWLCARKPELVDEYLRDHLLTWAPHFLDELIPCAREPFYEGLARLTRATLVGAREELAKRGLIVREPRFYR